MTKIKSMEQLDKILEPTLKMSPREASDYLLDLVFKRQHKQGESQ